MCNASGVPLIQVNTDLIWTTWVNWTCLSFIGALIKNEEVAALFPLPNNIPKLKHLWVVEAAVTAMHASRVDVNFDSKKKFISEWQPTEETV